jgi:hypothetical protein
MTCPTTSGNGSKPTRPDSDGPSRIACLDCELEIHGCGQPYAVPERATK